MESNDETGALRPWASDVTVDHADVFDHQAEGSNGSRSRASSANATSGFEHNTSPFAVAITNFTQRKSTTAEPDFGPQNLRQTLLAAQCQGKDEKLFIPLDQLEKLITWDSVHRALEQTKNVAEDTHVLTNEIIPSKVETSDKIEVYPPSPEKDTNRQKIFAILSLCEDIPAIVDFIRHGIRDSDLPLKIEFNEGVPTQFKDGLKWSVKSIATFDYHQWILLAPYFRLRGDRLHHYDLRAEHVLPFIECDRNVYRGYIHPWRVKIHPAHHDMSSSYGSISPPSQERRSTQEDTSDGDGHSFVLRVHQEYHLSLEVLSNLKHTLDRPQIVYPLAIFQHGDYSYDLLPWVNGDFIDFWKTQKLAPADQKQHRIHVNWVARQCLVLAEGVELLQGVVLGSGLTSIRDLDHNPAIQQGAWALLTHSMILYFRNSRSDGIEDLGCFKLDIAVAQCSGMSLTWGPPESEFDKSPPAAWNIWSLGCALLELVTWYMLGSGEVEQFSRNRAEESDHEIMTDDYYIEAHETSALKPSVLKELSCLREHERCSAYIFDLLEVIQGHLLDVNPHTRWTSTQIVEQFRRLSKRCIEDPNYCTSTRDRLVHGSSTLVQHNAPTTTSYTPTDSGYASVSILDNKTPNEQVPTFDQVTEEMDVELSDAGTEYTGASSVSPRQSRLYVSMMVNILISAMPQNSFSTTETDSSTFQRVTEVLPEVLKAFALKIGHCASTELHRQVMYFAHKYQPSIVRDFEANHSQDDEDHGPILAASSLSPMTLDDRMGRFFSDTEMGAAPEPEPEVTAMHDGIPNEHEEYSDGSDLEEEPDETPEMNQYHSCVVESPVYTWLQGVLRAETTLTPAVPDVRSNIRTDLIRFIKSRQGVTKLSRSRAAQSFQIVVQVNWDPRLFISNQKYEEAPKDAIASAITLTGSARDCQAMSTMKYLSQTWPSVGSHVMRLIQGLVSGEPGDRHSTTLPDNTTLLVWISGVASQLMVKLTGPVPSVAEVVEQFAWLGSALRSSPRGDPGLYYCTPFIKHGETTSSLGKLPSTGLTCQIDFALEKQPCDNNLTDQGQCWHDMFWNPVIVRGYPTSRRSTATDTGLEMPLNMMARIVRADCAISFASKWYLKGFSSMLVLAGQRAADNVYLWHHVYNSAGDHVSYFDEQKSTLSSVGPVALSDLENSRHVVGWCSDVKLYAGNRELISKGAFEEGGQNIGASCLPRPHATCVLEHVSLNAGRFISGGVGIALGVRESPIHLRGRDGYGDKMRWISGQYAILWDEDDQRGWLVNGATALLYLVLASLHDDLEWKRRHDTHSDILFKWDEMITPLGSPLNVLMNERNREQKISVNDVEEWDEIGESGQQETRTKTTYKRFKHLVGEQFRLLEQVVDQQFHIEDRAGLNMKRRVRQHLEGWDFKDLAATAKTKRIYPRLKTLQTMAHGWVDFTRDINAITLFGKGFGEVVQPTKSASICDTWARVPVGKYYLAACISDLKAIIGDDDGGRFKSPIKMGDRLLWDVQSDFLWKCKCGGKATANNKHSDIVQVLVPTRPIPLRKGSVEPKNAGVSVELKNAGAVIFGYNSIYRVRWPSQGAPCEAAVALDGAETDEMSDLVDSGVGMSTSSQATNDASGEAQASPLSGALVHATQAVLDRDGSSGPDLPRPKKLKTRFLRFLRAGKY